MERSEAGNATRELSRRLGIGARDRALRSLRATRRRLRMDRWFPHVPLFPAVLALAVLQLAPVVRHALELVQGQDILAASGSVFDALLHGAPTVLAGLFLLLMCFGLPTRSRLAWVITVLVSAATLALSIWHPPNGVARTGLATYNALVLLALLLAWRQFNRSSVASATLFGLTSVAALMAYAVVGAYVLGPQFSPPIASLTTALYFGMTTMSTVGYGDITPKSSEARLFAVSVMVLGITVFATSLSALLVPLMNRRVERLLRPKERTMSRSNHYVIVGDTALARNTHRELAARDQPVTFVMEHAPAENPDGLDIVTGDGSSLDVLRRADAQAARAVLALGDDDSENAFVVMAVKELAAEGDGVKTVTVVNHARNLPRVKRVHPDLIIAPQVLGGELLAMALSGEKLDNDRLMQQLLHVRE